MDFAFNDDQIAIRDLANQIFSDRATDEFLLTFDRAAAKTGNSFDDTLWATLAEAGLLGICVPESAGGTGMGFVELCLILEEQGRRVAPVPLFSSIVLGGLPIAEFGTDAQQQQWLAPLATGSVKLSAAVADFGMIKAVQRNVSVRKEADGWILNGEKTAVPDGAVANTVLVPAVDANGKTSIFIVDVTSAGVTVKPQLNFSGTRKANIVLDNVKIGSANLLGKEGEGQAILDWLELRADTALSAMLVGICDEALKRTAAFTCERKQFGVAIGSFQAVAMRAADAFIDLEAMRSMVWHAMWRLSSNLDADVEVRSAKWWATMGSHRVVHAAQHLHGGMGADKEYPIHRYFVLARELTFMLGNSATQMTRLGEFLASDDSVGVNALAV